MTTKEKEVLQGAPSARTALDEAVEKWRIEIALIREENDRIDRTTGERRVVVLQTANGWTVRRDDRTGVAPPTEYKTAAEAAARMLQLLDIKTRVAPQTWPERVIIGDDGSLAMEPKQ